MLSIQQNDVGGNDEDGSGNYWIVKEGFAERVTFELRPERQGRTRHIVWVENSR